MSVTGRPIPSHLRHFKLHSRIVQALPKAEARPKQGGWKQQVAVPFIAPGARESVLRALDSGEISSATRPVRDLEQALREFYNVPTAKACSSGYASLVMGLKLGKIGPGDEVVIPSLTMVAVYNAVATVGAKAVFVDCAPERLNPTPAQYKEKFTDSTKAVIVTYTYGTSMDTLRIAEICKEKGLVLIEDISEAVGLESQGRIAGTIGDYGCASMYANKLITSGDGGFLISKHGGQEVFNRAQSYTNHAFVKEFHFVHFEHSGNFKMSGLAAALAGPAVAQIPKLTKQRNQIATRYRELLDDIPGIETMEMSEFGPDAPWVFGIEVQSPEMKNFLRKSLAEDYGIETRDYFFPLHLQPVSQVNDEPDILPNAERYGKLGFYLPTHANLTNEDISYVTDSIWKIMQSLSEF